MSTATNTPDQHYVMALAEVARRVGNTSARLENLLEGSISAARWNDTCLVAGQMLIQFAHGNLEAVETVAANLIKTQNGNELEFSAAKAAVAYLKGSGIDEEYGQIHLRSLAGLVVQWANLMARAEQVEAPDVVLWAAGADRPAHWGRFATKFSSGN